MGEDTKDPFQYFTSKLLFGNAFGHPHKIIMKGEGSISFGKEWHSMWELEHGEKKGIILYIKHR